MPHRHDIAVDEGIVPLRSPRPEMRRRGVARPYAAVPGRRCASPLLRGAHALTSGPPRAGPPRVAGPGFAGPDRAGQRVRRPSRDARRRVQCLGGRARHGRRHAAADGHATAAPAALARAAVVATAAPTASHPFSDPLWLPLRDPARISCADQLHAAAPTTATGRSTSSARRATGSTRPARGRLARRTTSTPGCKTSATDIEAGTWVWVDHGGGRITKYNHLDSIVAREDQRVTPQTIIGRMGHSGDVLPCTTNYLHFEVVRAGSRVCGSTPARCSSVLRQARIRMPDARGVASWNEPGCPA